MLYILRSNKLAAKKLREMGCALVPCLKESYDYDYDENLVYYYHKIFMIEGWSGSKKSFSRFLKQNGLRLYQQKAEREAEK